MQGSLRAIHSGQCSWDLYRTVDLERRRRQVVAEEFPYEGDEHGGLWHKKLAVQEIDEGDLIALDRSTIFAPLVYLRRQPGSGHGEAIGPTFLEAIDRWSALGCVGPSYLQWEPFVSKPGAGLDVTCRNATPWQKWLGLPPA